MNDQSQDTKLREEIDKASLRKLNLEISALKWQNSLWGVLSKSTTLITVAITLLTVSATLIGWALDRMRERELRSRELAERTENQYRTDIDKLLRYPTDTNQTTSSVIFTFNDLTNVVEKGYTGDELEKRRLDVGTLIGVLVTSEDFDLAKMRNVEFDYAALRFCDYYSKAMIKEPRYTRMAMEKYVRALAPFHTTDEKFKYVAKRPGAENRYELAKDINQEGFTPKLRPFVTMVRAYELHLALLNRSMQENPGNADTLKRDIEKATCDFFVGTQNRLLTTGVFKIEDAELDARIARCRN